MPKLGFSRQRKSAEFCKSTASKKIRQSGSHIIMQKKSGNDTKTVPVPNHSEIAKGTLKSVIQLSGLDVSLFQK